MTERCERCGFICEDGCTDETDSYHTVTIRFKMPEGREDLREALMGSQYASALWNIHEKCRTVWKYEDDPSPDRVALAEEISDLVAETGVLST